ncbi:MAG: hypothetical protein MJY42_05360, partial [Bacteroidales bacterium]|nr:hypothetical protein [Bacteroidales bacterium]
MLKDSYRIAYNVPIADRVWRMRLLEDTSAYERGGQYADVAVDGFFLVLAYMAANLLRFDLQPPRWGWRVTACAKRLRTSRAFA